MSEFQSPTPEEIAALTPERIRAVIEELEAKTYPKEAEPAIQIKIAGLRKLAQVRERLALPDTSLDDIREIIRWIKP